MKGQAIWQIQGRTVRAFQISRDFRIAKGIATHLGRTQLPNGMDNLPRIGRYQRFSQCVRRGEGPTHHGETDGQKPQ